MDLSDLINSGFLNIDLLEELYTHYRQNPDSVELQWKTIFDELEASDISLAGKHVKQKTPNLPSHPTLEPEHTGDKSVLYYPKVEISSVGPDLRIQMLIDAYRTYGHLAANTNPINTSEVPLPKQLEIENFGFCRQDLSLSFNSCGLFDEESCPLLNIVNGLKAIYCDKIGYEYMNVHSNELRDWLQKKIEHHRFRQQFSIDQKMKILDSLNRSEVFESFIHTKYVGQKRFSLEGGETLIPMLSSLIDTGAALNIDEYIIGMAHRGRLNVLANIFDKSYADIFSEFEDSYIPASVEGSGDVKYHSGFYSELKTLNGHEIQLTLVPNPSHLESVDPVVEGQTFARQILREDDTLHEKVIPILIHGDAALAGQGVVYETLQLSQLEGYATGGTIHVVINNQIGFTTLPKFSRSTKYATDIALIFGAPVFHVNAEDPEACVFVANLAVELRQKFHLSVFIDLVCYRKYGHNETDEPAFTQPLQYQLIRKKRPICEIYREELIQQGVLKKQVAEELEANFKKKLQDALQENKQNSSIVNNHVKEVQTKSNEAFQTVETAVSKQVLHEVCKQICQVPDGFTPHPKLTMLLKERFNMLKEGGDVHFIDWGMAEMLAYGTILDGGIPVRISGQDCCRGTFSHRHALLMDQTKDVGYISLNHIKKGQGRFDIHNSPLSEYAVLGFEFGYSVATPKGLTIWEAQFGDFANGAQIIIDQYISTCEQKWSEVSGLTLLLPHGFEGQGPEHSSARIERFLTLCGENNMRIVNPTSPAQFFHLLRRQALSQSVKPLIVFTPKGLLRHPSCVSRLEDFETGTFKEIIDDPVQRKKTRRLVLCSGRIYYDLVQERDKMLIDDMAIVRIEQLYPFDMETLKAIISKCQGLEECIFVQEEPSNMGAWNFIRSRISEILPKNIDLRYIGRSRSASPAVGSHVIHKREHLNILKDIFNNSPYAK